MRTQRLVHEGLLISAACTPLKTALVADGTEYSYRDLTKAAHRLAGYLAGRGMNSGDRVVLWLDNGWAAVIGAYAVWLAGGVVVAVNPQTRFNKLRFIIKDCEASILLGENRLLMPNADELATIDGLGSVVQSGRGGDFPVLEEITAAESSSFSPGPVVATDLAALIYTSGSTGEPKGVMHSHQTILFAAHSIIEYLGLEQHDSVLCVLPLSFDYGLYQMLMAVQLGATLVLERSFAFPSQLLGRLRESNVTVFPGVPTLFANLIDLHRKSGCSFPSVRVATNTAAALPPEFIAQLRGVFPKAELYSMYGLTECKRATFLEPAQLPARPDSVGKAIPGTEAFVLRDDGMRAAPGEVGTLHIRGPHVMLGYWNRPEETEKMLRPGRWPGDRILCTHDLFRTDEEGYLYFVGRTDDVVKCRGEKVSPFEIEKVLCRIDGVRHAAAVAVPDPVNGAVFHAYVEPDGSAQLNRAYLQEECRRWLEPVMLPKHFEVVDRLPRSANGKIDRRAVVTSGTMDPFTEGRAGS